MYDEIDNAIKQLELGGREPTHTSKPFNGKKKRIYQGAKIHIAKINSRTTKKELQEISRAQVKHLSEKYR